MGAAQGHVKLLPMFEPDIRTRMRGRLSNAFSPGTRANARGRPDAIVMLDIRANARGQLTLNFNPAVGTW